MKKIILAAIWPVIFAVVVNAAPLGKVPAELDKQITSALSAAVASAEQDEAKKSVVSVSAVWQKYKKVKLRQRYGLNKGGTMLMENGELKTNCTGILKDSYTVVLAETCFLPKDVVKENEKLVIPGYSLLPNVSGDKEVKLETVSLVFSNKKRVEAASKNFTVSEGLVYIKLNDSFAKK